MVKLHIVNWRCIEDLSIELSRINVFVGPNSTGKSSLAYAVYFASKVARYDPHFIIMQLYGYDFRQIARIVEGKPLFPVSISLDGFEFSVSPKPQWSGKPLAKASAEKREVEFEELFETIKPKGSPWADEYLLSARRLDYLHISLFAPKLIRAMVGRPEAEALVRMFGGWLGSFFELLKAVPLLPPLGLFLSDYVRGLTGIRVDLATGGFKEAGYYVASISNYITLVDVSFEDPFTKLRLPADLGPDGMADFYIFDIMSRMMPENSLVVIEEPEICKNPRMILDFAEHMVKKAVNKQLTLLMTTHSDLPLLTMAKLVQNGELKSEDVRIYYLKRDERKPWTQASEIRVYDDGTLEHLPDMEEVISRLF